MSAERATAVAFFLVLASCATAAEPEPASPAATRADSSFTDEKQIDSLRVPRILPTVPESGALDMGPVLLESGGSSTVPASQALLAAASQLGADAFVADTKPVKDVYRLRTLFGKDLGDRTVAPDWTDDAIYHGPYSRTAGPDPSKDVFFYHAIKFIPDDTPPCELSEGWTKLDLVAEFGDAVTLRDQFALMNALFVEGVLSMAQYRSLRAECAAQLPQH